MPTVALQGYGSVTVDIDEGTASVEQVQSLPTAGNAFTLGDLGDGLQLTHLRMNGRDWNFDSAPFLRVLLFSGSGDPRDVPFNVGDLGTPTVVQDATSFLISWDTANLGVVIIQGAFVNDYLELGCLVNLQGIAAATFREWAIDFPYLRVKAYEYGTRTDSRLLFTQTGGLVIVDPTQALDPTIYPNGYETRHPEDLPYPIDQTDAGNTPAAMKWMALAHRGKRTALALRATEHPLGNQPLTGWNYNSDGDGTVHMWLRNYPPDNSLTAINYTLPYKAHLAPLAGEWWDTSKWYRDKVEAEAPPWLPAKIKDETTTRMPAAVKNARVILWLSLVYGSGRTASITRCLQQVQRAVARFGSGVVLFLYGWKTSSDVENHPDYSPQSDVTDLATACVASGASVVLYTIPHRWDPSSQFVDDNPTALDYVAHDAFANPKVRQLGPTAASNHYFLNHIHPAGTAFLQDQLDLAIDAFAPDILGIYWDAAGATGLSDYRLTLGAADRGPGGTSSKARLTTLDTLRTALGASGSGTNISSEMPDEYLMKALSWAAPWNVGNINAAFTHLPLWQTCFSEYAPTMSFDTVFCTTPSASTSVKRLAISLDIWMLGRQFVNGATMTIADILDRPMPWFVQSGETNFSEAELYHKPILDWMESATDTLDQAAGPMRKYLRGQRLRPLAGSWDDYVDSRGFTPIYADYLTNAGAGAADPFPGTAIHSAVWRTEEEDGNPLCIFFSNFRPVAATVTIAMTPEDYPAMVASRKLLYSNVGGVRTLLQTFYGHVSYTTSVPAHSNAMFELILQNDVPPVVDVDEEDTALFVVVI